MNIHLDLPWFGRKDKVRYFVCGWIYTHWEIFKAFITLVSFILIFLFSCFVYWSNSIVFWSIYNSTIFLLRIYRQKSNKKKKKLKFVVQIVQIVRDWKSHLGQSIWNQPLPSGHQLLKISDHVMTLFYLKFEKYRRWCLLTLGKSG